jgi:excisionase family DNA binding protein
MKETQTIIPRLTYSVEETARALGVGRDLVYKLVHTGTLGAIRSGRGKGFRIRIPVFELEAFVRREIAKNAVDPQQNRLS